MKEPSIKKDRRKKERYQLKTNIFASIGKTHPIMGQIINISMNGIAISYIADKNNGHRFETVAQLGEEDPGLENIPFTTVHDIPMTIPDPYSSVEIRKHSGMFGELSKYQYSKIQAFIQKNASVVNGKLAVNMSFNKTE